MRGQFGKRQGKNFSFLILGAQVSVNDLLVGPLADLDFNKKIISI
jgi:hypothetical protein